MDASAAPAPVRPKDRITALDVLRGLGVLGILMVNAASFAAPPGAYFNPVAWPFPFEGASYLAWAAVHVFFTGKFVTLFTMLFGVSVFLVGGEREDDDRGRLLRRRLLWLLLFGVIHGALIWYGDILTLYALAGLVFLLMRSFSARRLLVIGVAMSVVGGLLGVGLAYMLRMLIESGQMTAEQLNSGGGSPVALEPAAVAAQMKLYLDGWSGAAQANFKDWTALALMQPLVFGWTTIALMSLGLGLFKSGFLKAQAPAWLYLVLIGIGAACLAYGWATVQGPGQPLDQTDVEMAVFAALTPFVTLGYASVPLLLVKARQVWLRPLAAAGQMAFTNYLSQSLIMTTIFWGGRGELMGQVDRPQLLLIVFGIWALQLVWSPLWLSKFAFGPFEWVWRSLTYGRFVPIGRAEADAAPAGA